MKLSEIRYKVTLWVLWILTCSHFLLLLDLQFWVANSRLLTCKLIPLVKTE